MYGRCTVDVRYRSGHVPDKYRTYSGQRQEMHRRNCLSTAFSNVSRKSGTSLMNLISSLSFRPRNTVGVMARTLTVDSCSSSSSNSEKRGMAFRFFAVNDGTPLTYWMEHTGRQTPCVLRYERICKLCYFCTSFLVGYQKNKYLCALYAQR